MPCDLGQALLTQRPLPTEVQALRHWEVCGREEQHTAGPQVKTN